MKEIKIPSGVARVSEQDFCIEINGEEELREYGRIGDAVSLRREGRCVYFEVVPGDGGKRPSVYEGRCFWYFYNNSDATAFCKAVADMLGDAWSNGKKFSEGVESVVKPKDPTHLCPSCSGNMAYVLEKPIEGHSDEQASYYECTSCGLRSPRMQDCAPFYSEKRMKAEATKRLESLRERVH